MDTTTDAPGPGPTPNASAPPTGEEVDALVATCRRERADALGMRRTVPGRLRAEVDAALHATRSGLAAPAGAERWAVRHERLLEERRALDTTDDEVRRIVRGAMREAAEALRATTPAAALAPTAVELVCQAGGFSRVLVSAVRGSRWIPLVVHSDATIDPDPQTLQAFIDAGNEIPLANLLAETEVVRRQTAVLVSGATLENRTFRPIVEAAGSSGYVCAPLVPGRETIGIVHADRVGQRWGANDDDRGVLAEFATQFAWILDRATTEETLARRTRRIEAELDAARDAINRTRAPAFDLAPEVVDPQGTRLGGSVPRRDSLLTRREREILELVSQGATNGGVAQRLTVSEETVKSHMRTILRKLHVTSRSAAVARFLRLEGIRDD